MHCHIEYMLVAPPQTSIYSFSHDNSKQDKTKRLHIWTRIIHYNLSFCLYNYLCASIMEKQCEKAKTPNELQKVYTFQRQSWVFSVGSTW